MAAAQARDLGTDGAPRAPHNETLHRRLREQVATYRDDRPLADDITAARR